MFKELIRAIRMEAIYQDHMAAGRHIDFWDRGLEALWQESNGVFIW